MPSGHVVTTTASIAHHRAPSSTFTFLPQPSIAPLFCVTREEAQKFGVAILDGCSRDCSVMEDEGRDCSVTELKKDCI